MYNCKTKYLNRNVMEIRNELIKEPENWSKMECDIRCLIVNWIRVIWTQIENFLKLEIDVSISLFLLGERPITRSSIGGARPLGREGRCFPPCLYLKQSYF